MIYPYTDEQCLLNVQNIRMNWSSETIRFFKDSICLILISLQEGQVDSVPYFA